MQIAMSFGSSAPLTGNSQLPCFVLLADADRLVRGAVKLLAHLHFDERALLLDHDDEIEAVGELLELALAQRPRARDLVEPDAEIVAANLVDAELVEGLAHVEIALADGDDADLRIAAARGDVAVEIVGAHEREHGIALVVVQARFHAEHAVAEADVEAAFRHAEEPAAAEVEGAFGNDDLHAIEAAVDDRGRLDRLVHALERDPAAAVARHRPAVETVVEEFLNARRVQDRDHHVDEVIFGLVRGSRGFRGVVVAHEREHAAVFRGSGEIGVAEHVAGAVDAGALAVPHGEHAVVLALAAQLGLLGAPDRGRRQVFVEAGVEADVVRDELARRAHELLVEPAKRRAAIAGDEAGGIEPGPAVALLLHQAEANKRLIAGRKNPALGQIVLVVERDVVQRHRAFSNTQVCSSAIRSCQGPRPQIVAGSMRQQC